MHRHPQPCGQQPATCKKGAAYALTKLCRSTKSQYTTSRTLARAPGPHTWPRDQSRAWVIVACLASEASMGTQERQAQDADGSDSSNTGVRPAGPLRPEDQPSHLPHGFPAPAEPEVTLVTKLRVQDSKQQFWSDFMGKCRLAWDVFFPGKPEVLSPRGAGKSRLQMIIVSDRCGLDLPTLLEMKNSSMAALAAQHGWQDMTEMELQVASVKPSGERIHMTLPLSSLPNTEQLRDSDEYVFESLPDGSDDEMEVKEESMLVERGASRA